MPARDLYHEQVRNALVKDEWTITVTNDRGGEFQEWFFRNFGLGGFLLPSDSGGTETIDDEDAYVLDLGELRSLLSAKTRLVSLASPQNPSGVLIPLQVIGEIEALIGEICPDAYLLVDETYREAVYADTKVTPSLSKSASRR